MEENAANRTATDMWH